MTVEYPLGITIQNVRYSPTDPALLPALLKYTSEIAEGYRQALDANAAAIAHQQHTDRRIAELKTALADQKASAARLRARNANLEATLAHRVYSPPSPLSPIQAPAPATPIALPEVYLTRYNCRAFIDYVDACRAENSELWYRNPLMAFLQMHMDPKLWNTYGSALRRFHTWQDIKEYLLRYCK